MKHTKHKEQKVKVKQKKQVKRLFPGALALCVMLAMLPLTAFATDGKGISADNSIPCHPGHTENCGLAEAADAQTTATVSGPLPTPACICEELCTETKSNTACPVCGAEGAVLSKCRKALRASRSLPSTSGDNPTVSLDSGSIVLSKDSASLTYTVGANPPVPYTGEITITQTNASFATVNTITVAEGDHVIILNGVNIDVSGTDGAAAMKIGGSGAVTVKLSGNNFLKSGLRCAGLQKDSAAETTLLTIQSAGSAGASSTDGTLTATGGAGGAGIGGGAGDIGSYITIAGGTVNATGGGTVGYSGGGSGIGGGAGGIGSYITIAGGTVNATGGGSGAYSGGDIGGGSGIGGGGGIGIGGGAGNDIVIRGGTVNATGGSGGRGGGSGIGGGGGQGQGGSGTTTIKGGTVTANGGHGIGYDGSGGGSGIGGGGGRSQGGSGTTTIKGGTVTANGGRGIGSSSGIGGGNGTSGIAGTSTTIIDGGSVKAPNIGDTPKNTSGASVYLGMLKNQPGVSSVHVDGTSFHIKANHPNDNTLYLYMTDSGHSVETTKNSNTNTYPATYVAGGLNGDPTLYGCFAFTPPTPAAPTLHGQTHNSITVNAVAGQKYSCTTTNIAPALSGDWVNGAGNPYTFPNLTRDTDYWIWTYTPTQDSFVDSQVSLPLSVRTTKDPIPTVNVLGISAPAAMAAPDTRADNGTGFSTSAVTWYAGSAPHTGSFGYRTAYTAKLTLSAETGYYFPDSVTATVDGNAAVAESKTAASITLSYTYPATGGEAPVITTQGLPSGKIGVAYHQPLSATGSVPITWHITSGSLPAGLVLTGDTISGTPTEAKTTVFTVTAENGTQPNAAKELFITVMPKDTVPVPPINPPDSGKPIDLTKDLVLGFDGEYKTITSIKLNGKELTRTVTAPTSCNLSGYPGYLEVLGKAESGSVYVTLYKAFLKTLPNGSYVLEVTFEDGTTIGKGELPFIVEQITPPAPKPAPDNGGHKGTNGNGNRGTSNNQAAPTPKDTLPKAEIQPGQTVKKSKGAVKTAKTDPNTDTIQDTLEEPIDQTEQTIQEPEETPPQPEIQPDSEGEVLPVPQTDSGSNPRLWMILLVLIVGGAGILIWRLRKNHRS